jgi:hypothetical protein
MLVGELELAAALPLLPNLRWMNFSYCTGIWRYAEDGGQEFRAVVKRIRALLRTMLNSVTTESTGEWRIQMWTRE